MRLGADASKAIFMGNTLLGGKEKIVDNSKSANVVGLGLNA